MLNPTRSRLDYLMPEKDEDKDAQKTKVQIRIEADLWEDFKTLAAENGANPSVLLRRFIKSYIKK